MVDSCWRYTVAVGGWIGIGAEVVETVCGGVVWVDYQERGTEFGAVDLLVCAIGAGAMGVRSLQFSAINYQFFIHLLSPRNDHTECADSGSGCTRSMGDRGLRIDERCLCRRSAVGDKHPPSMPRMVLF